MVFVDIHAHLDFKDFDVDRDKLVSEMKDKNIMALSNTLNPKNYEYTKNLFKKSSQVNVCPGLYPRDAMEITDKDFNNYLKLIKKDIKLGKVKALGEVGLDFTYVDTQEEKDIQIKRFRQIIEFGIEQDLPLIIHTRKAETQVIELLREYIEKCKFRKFVLHCFSGKKRLIKDIISLKLYCSIPMIVCNTQSFQILVDELPISQILVETDSPFLNPKKTRNSSLNVPIIYQEIAKLKGLDSKEIENIIYKNYMNLML